MYSYLFRNATIVDGSGSPPFRGDVALAGSKIAALAPRIDGGAVQVVDASGLVLAPGFIDIHGHSDTTIHRRPGLQSKAFQGVTLEVTGNCGLGVFPVADDRRQELVDYLRLHDFHLPADGLAWHDFASWADRLDRGGLGINLAPLVGHAPLRIAAMGTENREPGAAELDLMGRLLDLALAQGAWGMSTGLIYPPGSFAGTAELIALARILAARGALYASHIRSESEGLFDSLGEAIAIGRESGARVQVSHLKALGRANWGRSGEALAVIAAARGEGVDIACDQYPYAASATTLAAVIPHWAQAGGVCRMLDRLADRELSGEIAAEIGREIAAREGAEGIVIANCGSPGNRAFSGRTIAEVARRWGVPPAEAVIRLMVEKRGAVGAIFFSMSEEDVVRILADPQVAVGSDGHGLDAVADAGEATHPRSYGTFPRVLGRYVRELNVLTLEAAVRKMTSLPASRLGLTDRGLIRPGFAADLVLFDPGTVDDPADYAHPHRYAQGVVQLQVAGEAVIENGRLTGLRPGRVLRRRC